MFNGDELYGGDPNWKFLTTGMLAEVREYASAGVTLEEMIEGYSINFDEWPVEEKDLFEKNYRLGRMRGIKSMSDNLFSQARSRNGTAAALAFLARFSKPYQTDPELANSELSGFTFNFKL